LNFHERSNAGRVEVVLNGELESETLQRNGSKSRVEVALYPGYADQPFRFMYDKAQDRARGSLDNCCSNPLFENDSL
jgi:hypothetical protein